MLSFEIMVINVQSLKVTCTYSVPYDSALQAHYLLRALGTASLLSQYAPSVFIWTCMHLYHCETGGKMGKVASCPSVPFTESLSHVMFSQQKKPKNPQQSTNKKTTQEGMFFNAGSYGVYINFLINLLMAFRKQLL